MPKAFQKLNVSSAVRSRSTLDLSRSHLTSLSMMQILPLFHQETIPGDSYSVDASIFSRMAPLVVPTFGRLDLKTMAVFVPYYQVDKAFDSFVSGQAKYNGYTIRPRHFLASDILKLFMADIGVSNSAYVERVSQEAIDSGAHFDLKETTSDGYAYYKFTKLGKYVYKVLTSLGYQIPTDLSSSNTTKYSAYPLLAFLRMFCELMSQSTKVNENVLSSALFDIKTNMKNSQITINGKLVLDRDGRLDGVGLHMLLNEVQLMFESDYFTTAWRYPNKPAGENYGSTPTKVTFTDAPDPFTSGVSQGEVNADNYNTTVTLSQNLTARRLQFLQAFDKFVRRSNLAGSRAVDQIYSRFGIRTEDFKSHVPDVIKTSSMPIQVGDIMCQSDTYDSATRTGMKVGEYTGKGIISGGDKFTFKASEYGMLFYIGWLQPRVCYPNGIERQCLRTSYLDYYNPEFDGMSGDVISVAEVQTNNKDRAIGGIDYDNNVYGFTEKYNDYRFGRDQITGDFKTLEAMESWHFGRDLSLLYGAGQVVAQHDAMVKAQPNEDEFDRIFAVIDGVEDQFYLTCFFGVNANRPIANLSEASGLKPGALNLDRFGMEIK